MSEIATVTDPISDRPFGELSDRELLVYIASSHRDILAAIDEIKGQVIPVIDSLASHPMLKPFLGGLKS